MKIMKIKKILLKSLNIKNIKILKKNNHYIITVISNEFININDLNRQKKIYSILMKYIINNHIHSISINTYTSEEWNNNLKLN